jgi:hypothetical protein
MTNQPNSQKSEPTFHRPPFWKRVYFILPEFQINFLAQISGIILFILAGFYGVEYYYLNKIILLEQSDLVRLEELYPLLRQQMDVIFAVKVIFLIFTFIIWGIFYSHKIAGPVWRVLRMIDDMKNGQAPKSFQLRQTDYFQELAQKLSELHEQQTNKKR